MDDNEETQRLALERFDNEMAKTTDEAFDAILQMGGEVTAQQMEQAIARFRQKAGGRPLASAITELVEGFAEPLGDRSSVLHPISHPSIQKEIPQHIDVVHKAAEKDLHDSM